MRVAQLPLDYAGSKASPLWTPQDTARPIDWSQRRARGAGTAMKQRLPARVRPLAPEPVVLPDAPRFLPAGDSAMVVEFGSGISPELNTRVLSLDRELQETPPSGLVETVPTYRSLMIVYDPVMTDFDTLGAAVESALLRSEGRDLNGRMWTVPVVYGGAMDEEIAADLAHVADHTGLSEREVIRMHSSAIFRVYMIGFSPGFSYLGGLPEPLHIPRRSIPKPRVEAGSVMIGGMQSAVASVPTPTGWYVLGQTPVRAFDMQRGDDTFLFRAGDMLRFEAIGESEFAPLAKRAAQGELVARLAE